MVQERRQISPAASSLQRAVSARRPGSRFPGSASGACFRFADSPWSRPFPPRTPHRLAPPCSPASTVLWPRPTSSPRSSQASDTSFPSRPWHDCRGRVKTSQVPVVGVHACLGSQTPRSSPTPRRLTVWAMLPSTHLTVSALRITWLSALNFPARMHRYRRFTPGLTADDARLAEKRGRLLLSFRGTFTRYPSTSSPGTPSVVGIAVKFRRNHGQMRQEFAAKSVNSFSASARMSGIIWRARVMLFGKAMPRSSSSPRTD